MLRTLLVASMVLAVCMVGVWWSCSTETGGVRRALLIRPTTVRGRTSSRTSRYSKTKPNSGPPDTSELNYIPIKQRLSRLPSSSPDNKISYVYVVGVEGVGHHGITPAIATIGKTCNQHVHYHDPYLIDAHHHHNGTRFQHYLEYLRRADFRSRTNSTQILLVDDGSFPTDEHLRNSTTKQKKSSTIYDLEWIFDEWERFGRANVKFFHLTRNFYRTVASHPEFDRTFARHAEVLHSFIVYIGHEYERIEAKKPGIWRQISYESFTAMENCTALVSAVIDFVGWDHCDVDFACEMLNSTLHRESRKKTIVPEHVTIAEQYNVSLPIPPLQIKPGAQYAFSTAVSERIPFTYAVNASHRNMARKQRVQAWLDGAAERRQRFMNFTLLARSNFTKMNMTKVASSVHKHVNRLRGQGR